MTKNTKKRGQKIAKRLSKLSRQASIEGRVHIQSKLINRIGHVRKVQLLVLEWVLLVGIVIFLAIAQSFWYNDSFSLPAYTTGGTYTEGAIGKVNSLNPLFANTSSEKTLSRLLFSSLSGVDYSGHLSPMLASEIYPDSTNKNWTVKLRPDLKWSDGQPLTAADVLFTVNLLQNPNLNTNYSTSLAGVTIKEEKSSLVFQLASPYADFISSLDFPILPAHLLSDLSPGLILEHNFSSKPVGSGPFTFNAVQPVGLEGEKIVYLAPNPHYYRSPALLSSFIVHAYPHSEQLKEALKTGAITATADLAPSDGLDLKQPHLSQRQTALGYGVFAFLNTTSPFLKNPKLRQAIKIGLDLPKLRSLLDGEGSLDFPLVPSQFQFGELPSLPTPEPASAAEIIKNHPLPDDTSLNLVAPRTGRFPELANQLAAQLTALGLKTSVNLQNPGQDFLINTVRPRAYDILLYEIELGPDPDLFPYYHSSQANESGLNLSSYSNLLADDLILGTRSTSDFVLRSAKYKKFLSLWQQDVPAIAIYRTNLAYYVNRSVRTFSSDHRLIYPTDRFNDITSWAVNKTPKHRTP